MAANRESALHHALHHATFTCFNVNCYATFKTERGLKQHLWRSEICGKYMSEPRQVLAASVDIQEPPGLNVSSTNDNQVPSTREVASGISYYVRSFLDPAKKKRLCRDVFFDTKTVGVLDLEENLSLFILQTYIDSDLDDNGVGSIRCCTEYHKYNTKTDEKMVSIRSHPNYRGKGYAWYDWALIRFVDDDGNKSEYPSRIVSIIPRQGSVDTGDETTTTFDLIVQCCGKPATRQQSFLLFTQWTFDKKFHVVSSEAIVGLCFVLGSPVGDSDVLVVTGKKK